MHASPDEATFERCNCLALRQATRRVTQFYDQILAPTGLRTTQYSILARLERRGVTALNVLAADLVMDRTTLGRNILPLERDGLIAAAPGSNDRRSKELTVTRKGKARLARAAGLWGDAQARFEAAFGEERSVELRSLLRAVTAADLGVLRDEGEP